MMLDSYLRKNISEFLSVAPYKDWPIEKTELTELSEPALSDVFFRNGLELRCNVEGFITTMFLYTNQYGGFDESLVDIPLSIGRSQVLSLYGKPYDSGEEFYSPLLGQCNG